MPNTLVPVTSDPEASFVAGAGALHDHDLLDRIATLQAENQRLGVLNKHLELNVKELARLVCLDPLTGLGNRRYFQSALASAIRVATRDAQHLALLLCDIDFFKHHNDTYGHAHGDEVLVQLAALLRDFRQTKGDCVARYGGEEFALVLPGLDSKASVAAAERLRASVAALAITHPQSGRTAQVTISVGVTSVRTRTAYSGEVLAAAADAALYRAKRAGRNRIKFDRADTSAPSGSS
ncbi:MAG: diguanylate cyclase [Gammaproteobacteria bacterium]